MANASQEMRGNQKLENGSCQKIDKKPGIHKKTT